MILKSTAIIYLLVGFYNGGVLEEHQDPFSNDLQSVRQ
jgi:hypothetical protein